jgi:NAD-reducing hydrogenase large subunit
MRHITIDPITRIEGHAKVTIHVNEHDAITEARLSVTQLRGFEAFCVGRPFSEMPSITARTCGICPVSHLIASSKACDAILAVKPPQAAGMIRRIINLAQIIQSHALSFFHLSSPDLLLGFDADPKTRNIFGLMHSHPEFAKEGIRLRSFGQRMIETFGGKRIHPGGIIPGGVSHAITPQEASAMLQEIPEMLDIAQRTLQKLEMVLPRFPEEIRTFGNFPSLFLAMIDKNRTLNFYEGDLCVCDAAGNVLEEGVQAEDYQSIIAETTQHDSYLKAPYFKPYGPEKGMYRVGALARLNIVDACGTPLADQALDQFRTFGRGAVHGSFYYHYARLIEIIFALEKVQEMLQAPALFSDHIQSFASPNRTRGVGISEAPRGALVHDYEVDRSGVLTKVNLVIATGNNALALNQSITQVAKHFVNPNNPKEADLNRVAGVVRAYDPCLSCSTHATGKPAISFEFCRAR